MINLKNIETYEEWKTLYEGKNPVILQLHEPFLKRYIREFLDRCADKYDFSLIKMAEEMWRCIQEELEEGN